MFNSRRIINRQPSQNRLFWNACFQGNLKLVRRMISNHLSNLNLGLRGACYGGHPLIVFLLISRGANDWHGGFQEAYRGSQNLRLSDKHDKIIRLIRFKYQKSKTR